MFVSMKNDAGVIRTVEVGFSWAALLFGGIPFFFRGMPAYGMVWLVLTFITAGISNLFLAFMINAQTARYYLDRGYHPIGKGWEIAGPAWRMTARPAPEVTNHAQAVRTCPWCAETIQLAARVCKHCGRELEKIPDQADQLRARLDALAQKNRL